MRPTGTVGEAPHAAGLDMRDLLYLAYHFPPQSSSGTFRLLGFARHLPAHGWRPVVITPRDVSGEPRDDGLLRAVPPESEVHRTRQIDPYRLWARWRGRRDAERDGPREPAPRDPAAARDGAPRSGLLRDAAEFVSCLPAIPDRRAGWIPFAVSRALALHSARPAAALFASGPPWSALVAGLAVARLARIPWVADLRDPWFGPGMGFLPFASLRGAAARLERLVIEGADRVVFNTETARELYARRFRRHAARFRVITNGIDEEGSPPAVAPPGDGAFTIVHTGEIYGDRRVDSLLEALSRLLETERLSAGAVRVRFIGGGLGHVRGALEGTFAGRPVARVVSLEEQVSHAEALQAMAGAHLLLAVGFAGGLQIPAKLFEYLRAGRSILALDTPGGAVEDVLRRAGGDWRLVPRDDPDAVEGALLDAYRDWTEGRSPRALPSLEPFRRERLAADLAAALEEAVAS